MFPLSEVEREAPSQHSSEIAWFGYVRAERRDLVTSSSCAAEESKPQGEQPWAQA
jgi:hypothetical protein